MAPVVKKSSQKVKNAVLVLLALWSIISLVVIVVWATSPDWKGSTACRAELLEVTEKMEAAKVVWNKNKVALEDLLKAERQQRDKQRTEISLLLERLSATNSTLEECQQEQVRTSSLSLHRPQWLQRSPEASRVTLSKATGVTHPSPQSG